MIKIKNRGNLMRKNKMIPLYKLFPSIITITAMCLGITAIHYAMYKKFEIAAALVFIAGFLDMLDGRVARMLNSTSEFGAQLDSLGDLINFGVAPGIIMYIWVLNSVSYHAFGWAIVVIYIVCSSLRLARFNITNIIIEKTSDKNTENKESNELKYEESNIENWRKKLFFAGLPMPGAAVICLLPMVLTFEMLPNFKFSPIYVAFHILAVGILMISTLPILSFKHVKINPKYAPITIIMMCVVGAVIIIEPWIFIPIFTGVYCVLIPISYVYYKNQYKNLQKNEHIAQNQ